MLIKQESDYGIRIVRALRDGRKQPVKNICREEEFPEAVAYKILRKLHSAGIVDSVRGADGGYWLIKEVSEVTLYDILLAVEPDFAVTTCMREGCGRNSYEKPCRVHAKLQEIQDGIVAQLRGQTMEEILQA